MRIVKAPVGAGFDASTYVTPAAAADFVRAGYQFAVRYIRRDQHVNDKPDSGWPVSLSRQELHELHDAGLAVSVVQFASFSGRRYLSGSAGNTFGYAAAFNARELGIPDGCTLWVDAEWTDAPGDAAVMSYLTAWGKAVAEAGYRPGCYVGYDGLTGDQWYSLPYYRAYWRSAIKYARVPYPRGWSMVQGLEHSRSKASRGRPSVFGTAIDTDHVLYDDRGDRPWFVTA